MTDQVASLTKEPPVYQLGLPPCDGAYSCAACAVAMIVRHETGRAVTAEQVYAASGNTDGCSGLTPGQALRALNGLGVTGYAYFPHATPSQALQATDRGIVVVGVGYAAYPTKGKSANQAEFGGKTDLGFAGPHSITLWGRRYWPPSPPGTIFQTPTSAKADWRCWVRDPDHAQGYAPTYDRMLTAQLSRAMAALVGTGTPPWPCTFMLARGVPPATAGTEPPGLNLPMDGGVGLAKAVRRPAVPPAHGKLGRRDPLPAKPRLRLGRYVAAVPVPPAAVDWYSKVEAWGMLLNDQLGCCVAACIGHVVESESAYAQPAEVVVTDADVLAQYRRVGGYVPGQPGTDQGEVIQTALGDWRRNGMAGYKCLAFAQVDTSNLAEVKQAIATFGSLDLGSGIPQSAIDQFDAGQPWDVVANDGGIVGGHSYEAVGYDAAHVYVVTWGRVQAVTWAWFAKYLAPSDAGEAWITITPAFVAANGLNPNGADLAQMGRDVAAITGDPDPFAQPPQAISPSGCLTVAAGALGLLALAVLR